MLGTSVRAKLIDVPVDGLRQAPAGICAIVIVMITYAITTLLQGLFGSIPINRLVGFSLMALLAYEWAATRNRMLHMWWLLGSWLCLCGLQRLW